MILFADGPWAQLLVAAAMIVLTATLLLRLYRYQARQKRRSTRPFPRRDPADADIPPPQADAWAGREVHFHELVRDLSARLDSKMVALGHLIREADRAAARLEAALDRASPAETPPPHDPAPDTRNRPPPGGVSE